MITLKLKSKKLEIANAKSNQKNSKGTGRLLIPSSILKSNNEFNYNSNIKVCSTADKVYLIPDKNFDKVDLDTDDFDIIDDKKIDKYGKISISAEIVKQLDLTNKLYNLSEIDNLYIILEE